MEPLGPSSPGALYTASANARVTSDVQGASNSVFRLKEKADGGWHGSGLRPSSLSVSGGSFFARPHSRTPLLFLGGSLLLGEGLPRWSTSPYCSPSWWGSAPSTCQKSSPCA